MLVFVDLAFPGRVRTEVFDFALDRSPSSHPYPVLWEGSYRTL